MIKKHATPVPDEYSLDIVRSCFWDRGFTKVEHVALRSWLIKNDAGTKLLLTPLQVIDATSKVKIDWRESLESLPVLANPTAWERGLRTRPRVLEALDHGIENAAEKMMVDVRVIRGICDRLERILTVWGPYDGASHINSLGEIQGSSNRLDATCLELSLLVDQREQLVEMLIEMRHGTSLTKTEYDELVVTEYAPRLLIKTTSKES